MAGIKFNLEGRLSTQAIASGSVCVRVFSSVPLRVLTL